MTDAAYEHDSILVVCESREGELESVSLSLIGEAVEWGLSDVGNLDIIALILGDIEDPAGILGAHGVQKAFLCADTPAGYAPEIEALTIARIARNNSAAWVFFAHTPMGSTLAPRVAALLEAGLVTHSLGVERDPQSGYLAAQPVHEGRLFQLIRMPDEGIKVLSWDPISLARRAPLSESPPAEIERIEHAILPDAGRVRPVRVIKGDPKALPLDEADRIVAIGRGVIPQGFRLAEEFAERFDASMGATRPVIDAQMLPFERQIGQTGASVSPRVLVTCGVSGANEFTVGITDSQLIVAINTNSQARIFSMADLGLVGDAPEIMRNFLNKASQEETEDSQIEPENGQSA